MRFRLPLLSPIAFLLVPALALAAPAAKGPKPKASDLQLPQEGFPPLPDAHRSLTSVPFAPGAPAVVLLNAKEYDYGENSVAVTTVRRVKVLTEAGSRWGDHELSFTGDWRIGKIRARTLLPDGTAVDATSDVHVEKTTDPDMTEIKVTFPRVQPGAILDLAYTAHADGIALREWVPQERIPVLESRLVMLPSVGMRYRVAPARMRPEEIESVELRLGDRGLFAWTFRDVPPLPSVPNMPPFSDLAKTLILVAESYRVDDTLMPLAADWKSWCRDMGRAWDTWLKRKDADVARAAAAIAGGAATPRDKAEAVRRALRERMSYAYLGTYPTTDSPDQALAQGRGSTADVAGVALSMLGSLGVPAQVAAYRLRSEGMLPTQFPAPGLLDDVLVMLPGAGEGGKDLFFDMTGEVPVGQLPPDALGVHVVPLGKECAGPAWLPDVPADRNAVRRAVDLHVAPDATVRGEAVVTATGPEASAWRRELRELSEDDRRRSVQDELRGLVPSAHLTAFEVRDLADDSKDLVVSLAWEASDHARRAGDRILLNPFVFERVSAADWGAETREVDAWLGRPHLHQDTVTIHLPEGVASVQLPAGAKLEAGAAGGYALEHSGADRTLRAVRTVRFEQTLFPAANWTHLRAWFQDMATADDQSIVITMAAAP